MRGVTDPALVIVDGNAGLRHAVGQTWPRAAVQRCVVHKLRNLEAHAPKRVLPELRADFQAITEAESLPARVGPTSGFAASGEDARPASYAV